jgi:transposase
MAPAAPPSSETGTEDFEEHVRIRLDALPRGVDRRRRARHLAPLAGFARNLRRDFDAVHKGLSLPHSSGAVEGNINRLRMLKRQMFGRAGLDHRIPHPPWTSRT